MYAFVAADLLALWDAGAGLHTVDRALLVLAHALPDRDPDELAQLPLGRRDAMLLEARRQTLGDVCQAQDVCPACGQRVEVTLRCSRLVSAASPAPAGWSIERDGYRVRLRPLDSRDTAAAARCRNVGEAAALLLRCSVVDAERAGRSLKPDELPRAVVDAVSASVAVHDSGAELMLDLSCPACARSWHNVFDVASFVWSELAARAQRLLLEVHTLARAYGWSEADVVALSEGRRAAYLELAAS